jgi:hypothetical protein
MQTTCLAHGQTESATHGAPRPHGDGCTYTLSKDIPMTTLPSDHQTIRSLSQTPSQTMPLTGAEYLALT